MGDADRSPAPVGMIRDQMLGKSAVVHQALLAEPFDGGLGRGAGEAARDQALRELAGAVVTAVLESQGREARRLRIVRGGERSRVRLPPPHWWRPPSGGAASGAGP